MSHKNIALFVTHAGCPHRCIFCDQSKISGHTGRITEQDIDNACSTAFLNAKPDDTFEIGFFGGSFTAIEREYMDTLLRASYPYVKSGKVTGIRISTRPDCINDEILAHLKSFGVKAIELGAQSMDNAVLAAAQRGHTAQDVERASTLIKKYGFSLGLQMMTGLPKSNDELDILTARRIARLAPDTVRIYPAITIKNTAMEALYNRGEYTPQTLARAVELCANLLDYFENECNIRVIKLGLQYEPSLCENYVAGPFHPAFRELCESARYLKRMRAMLCEQYKNKKLVFFTAPSKLSKVIGQRKSNINALQSEGFCVTVKADSAEQDIRLEVGE